MSYPSGAPGFAQKKLDGLRALTVEAGGMHWAFPAQHIGRTIIMPLQPHPTVPWLQHPAAEADSEVITVVDLAQWWALPQPTNDHHPRLAPILFPAKPLPLGLTVDRIGGLRTIALTELQPLPTLFRDTLVDRGCWSLIPPYPASTSDAPTPIIWLLDFWALLRAAVEQLAALEIAS